MFKFHIWPLRYNTCASQNSIWLKISTAIININPVHCCSQACNKQFCHSDADRNDLQTNVARVIHINSTPTHRQRRRPKSRSVYKQWERKSTRIGLLLSGHHRLSMKPLICHWFAITLVCYKNPQQPLVTSPHVHGRSVSPFATSSRYSLYLIFFGIMSGNKTQNITNWTTDGNYCITTSVTHSPAPNGTVCNRFECWMLNRYNLKITVTTEHSYNQIMNINIIKKKKYQ